MSNMAHHFAATYRNRSNPLAALVLPTVAVATCTSTTPAAWAGLIALILESDSTTKPADVPLNLTEVTAVNPHPLMFTVVPPMTGPAFQNTPVTVGPEP